MPESLQDRIDAAGGIPRYINRSVTPLVRWQGRARRSISAGRPGPARSTRPSLRDRHQFSRIIR